MVLLSACAPFRSETRPSPTEPLPKIIDLPTPTSLATMIPSPSPTDEAAVEEATAVPINVVISASDTNCLTPIVAPTPADIPAVGGLDTTTGRYVMGVVQVLDEQSYRLQVSGRVDHPLSLTYDEIRCMPKMTETVTTTCYNFQNTATWSGVLISNVLKKAGVQPGATKLTQTGADGASRTVPLDMAMDPHNFLAFQMGSKPLPILFGFPVRSIFINVAGQYSVKWLTALEVG